MQTVILAAGRGTRMRPLTDTTPKPMLPVAGRPIVDHVAAAAVAAGATRLVLVVGVHGDSVREYFGDSFRSVPVDIVEQDEQRGTADAVRAARSALTDDAFAVLNGDVLVEPDDLANVYDRGPAVGAVEVSDPRAYGVFELDDAGYVRSVIEKPADPPSRMANAGAYLFPAAALDQLDGVSRSDRGELELTDVLNWVCKSHAVSMIECSRWLDIGRPWELLAANEWKLPEIDDRRNGNVASGAVIQGPVIVAEGAEIREGATIEGPVIIGPDARVGPNAYVRGASYLGPETTVGHAVEVKNSLLFAGATVGHQAYVGDSILGRDVNFGAGTNVANLRHDGESIRTVVKGEVVSTGRRKYGVVVGDRVRTGIDTSLNAGVVLPSAETTLPGETILKSPR